MMSWLHTLRGRMIVLVAVGALFSHLIGLGIYFGFNASSLSQAREQIVVERLATAARLIDRVPAERRAETVDDLSEPDFRLNLDGSSYVHAADSREEDTRFLRASLALALAFPTEELILADYELARGELALADFDADPPRTVLVERVAQWFRFREDLFVSLQLSDGSWLNARVRARPLTLFLNPGLLWSLGLMAVSVSALTAWAVARPLAGLRRFAGAAEVLGIDVENTPALADGGPLEIQRTARAFNRMRERIQNLIEDRTRMLSAMSHDLRTPLTRLRLRAEYIDRAAEKEKMLRDIADMEEMVSASLRLISDGAPDESREEMDFISLLTQLSIDMGLEPPEFRLQGAQRIRVVCAPLAMRRAFTNLLDNAKKYAGGAELRVSCHDDEVVTEVLDHGPGIPPDEYENVFKPYYRLEPSRSRQTGGYGLGLAIARAVIRAHGGDIGLHPAPGGGLLARVRIPLA